MADLPRDFILGYFRVRKDSRTDLPWEGTWHVWEMRTVRFKLEHVSWIRESQDIRLGLKCGDLPCQTGKYEHKLTTIPSYRVRRNFLVETVKRFCCDVPAVRRWGNRE